MTKEQAIERLKSKLDNDKEYLEQCNPFSDLVNEVRLDNKSIETVLSMLEEKDKQIDKLKKHNDDLLRKLRNRVKDVKKLQKYSLYKQEFSRLNKQLQNKEKIIDLMAEYISNITDCPFESEGKYLDCEKMCDVRTDKECWKQYFENKVKETEDYK